MKLHNILLVGMMILLSVACTDEEFHIDPQQPTNAPEINIEGVIHQQYTTRVDDGGFCDGDQIGLYGVNYTDENSTPGTLLDEGNQVDNARYTFDEANWTWRSQGSVYFKDAVTHIDLYGYYPYGSPKSVDAYVFEVRQDQSGDNVEDGYALSDFLWGKATGVSPTDQKIRIKFSHIMACANVILTEGSGFAEGEFVSLDKQVVVANTTRQAHINLATGAVTAQGKATAEGTVMKQSADGFRAVVVPQSLEAGNALFIITLDGITYRFKRDNAFTYASGKQQKFTIKVSKKEVTGEYEFTLVDTEIVDWVADLESHGGEARQYYVVNQEEPGTLSRLLRAAKKNPDKIKNLKISGKIDACDFFFMRDSMAILQAINLKESEICATTCDSWYKNGRTTETSYKDNFDVYNGYNAHEIPLKAFESKNTLVYFVFPEKVTKIGEYAFYFTLLSGALIIPNDVEVIEDNAFSYTNITSLQLPDGIKELGSYAFCFCSSLSGTLHLPESLEYIGTSCFSYCSMLSGNLVLPSRLTLIKSESFRGCGFTGDLVIPESVVSIGSTAFYSTQFKGRLYLPTGLKEIDTHAFAGCKFQGELAIPYQVQNLSDACFDGNNFTSVIFAENSELIKIGSWAFCGNHRLCEPVVLPPNLVTIGSSAFYGCSQLPAITIPQNVSVIGQNAFSNCSYLTSITCHAKTPPIVGSGAFDGVAKDNFTVEVPEQSVVKYQTAGGWGEFRRIGAHHDFSISRPLMRTLNAEYSHTYILRAPSGMPWSIENCPEWVTVSPSSGVGKTEVTVTVDEMSQAQAGSFTIETFDGSSYNTSTHAGRAGEVVFLLDGKNYRSTMTVQQFDCSIADGDVIENQRATVGGGVNLVFMGDCFDAKDIAEGNYIEGVNEAIGYFFGIEPYKSYRDYFNVYTVVGMSEDSGMGTANTIKSAKFGSMYSLDGITPDTETTYRYAMKAPTVEESNINRTLVVMVENTTDYGGICYMWGDGSAIAICPMSRDAYPYDFRGIVQHEAGGHGFAKLGDEYIYTNAFIQSCSCNNPHLDSFYAGKNLGWYRNLSDNGDMKTVEWAHFIYHNDYSNIVDMYEGGYFHTRGIYRSEATSCMNNNIPYFSAISRQEMVERIMEYAGLPFSIDEFYARDVRDASNNDITRSLVVDDVVTRAAASKQMPPKFMGNSPQIR
ncbi:MAG: leucine-rich repeat protein [Bacteroidaceae bacterium]|nr:leucine-rich repeat protein [Bacteroidaceae bacterium]